MSDYQQPQDDGSMEAAEPQASYNVREDLQTIVEKEIPGFTRRCLESARNGVDAVVIHQDGFPGNDRNSRDLLWAVVKYVGMIGLELTVIPQKGLKASHRKR